MTTWKHGVAWKRITIRLAAGALACLTSIVTPAPVNAEEDTGGLLGAISDLFKPATDESVDVPKRRKAAATPANAPPKKPKKVDEKPASALQDAISDLFKPASDESVDVPKRHRPAAAATPAAPETSAATPARAPAQFDVAGTRAKVQLSRALQEARNLITEIELLREEMDVRDPPPRAAVLLEDRAPVHVYVKSLEVLAKVTEAQRRVGMRAGTSGAGDRPLRNIHDSDVLLHIRYTHGELQEIKDHLGIERRIDPAPLETGGTSSMVYQSLANASLMLDALRGGPLTSGDVHRRALAILDELAQVANELDVALSFDPPEMDAGKTSGDVMLQMMLATYKIVDLQTKLRMEPSAVPAASRERITPSENYDAANILLAEVARIKVHLGLDVPRKARTDQPADTHPSDVLALIQLIVRNIDTLSAAVGD